MKSVEEMMAEFHESLIIRCPYCNTEQMNDDNQYPVTYHGEEPAEEWECDTCEKMFYVEEQVERKYFVGKQLDEFGCPDGGYNENNC